MKRSATFIAALLAAGSVAAAAAVTTPAAGAVAVPAAKPDGGAANPRGSVLASCVEHLPQGKARPKLTGKLPSRGISGHVTTLEVTIEHGKGETVLPNGFHLQRGGEGERTLERAGFALPDPNGGAAPTLKTRTTGQRATTTVKIPLVALPPKPGRQELTLPPLPITIARASGNLITLCTQPHEITIDDPTASTPHAKPHENPPPRRQIDEWTTARNVTYAVLLALVIGALLAWLLGRWFRRPRPEPAPPPPRPPWEVALEELFDIRHAGLIEKQRFSEHFDRVSYSVRKYLGDRYGFDGLESTTREILGFLDRVTPTVTVVSEIKLFLRDADLVKFARLTPTGQDCATALDRGEHIVRRTVPAPAGGGLAKPEAPVTPDEVAGEPTGSPGEEERSPYAPPGAGSEETTGEQNAKPSPDKPLDAPPDDEKGEP